MECVLQAQQGKRLILREGQGDKIEGRWSLTTNLLLDLQPINNWGKLAEDLVRFLVVLQLSRDKICQIPERFRRIQNLEFFVSKIYQRTCTSSRKGAKNLTFFITPTASSVWPTNSSSACSISARSSSLRLSKSPLDTPFLALIESSINLAFSTFLRALVANIRLVFNVVFQPARNRLWI